MSDGVRLLDDSERVVDAAAALLVKMQGSRLRTERKTLRDVVTEADLASEKIVLEGLRRLTPDADIVSEEAGRLGRGHATRWIVDPLDGTVNFAAGLPWFSVTVAYQDDGLTVLGVTYAPLAGVRARYLRGELATVNGDPAIVSQTRALGDAVISVVLTSHFSSDEVRRTAAVVGALGERTRGVRIVVSGALEMSLVAMGRLDAFVSLKADVVSHAAAMPLVRAAGGRVTTLDGRDAVDEDIERVASNGRIHDDLLHCIAEALR
jgi:myo-inositol-1(or 4)-monophosphatase